MTSAVARRLSIPDRGLLQEACVPTSRYSIRGPSSIMRTTRQPHQLSTGVRYVFVNGVAVVRREAYWRSGRANHSRSGVCSIPSRRNVRTSVRVDDSPRPAI